MILKILLLLLLLAGCTIVAYKGDEKMVLKGFGAKRAKFTDGSEIEKEEPFRVPDIEIKE